MVGEESIQMRETKNVMVSRDLSPFPRHSSSPAGSVSIRPLGQIRVECGDKEGEREAFDPNSPPADRPTATEGRAVAKNTDRLCFLPRTTSPFVLWRRSTAVLFLFSR